MKTGKKLLILVLSMLMLLSVVPIGVSAVYSVGDTIQFGSYPQSEVTDAEKVAELNAVVPSWDKWTSYGYYSGNGNVGSMIQGDWMRYTDVTYGGEKYRAVKFLQYRPDLTYYSFPSIKFSYGYNTNTVYWFKFEPIDWRVLDPNTGLVMCESIIDSQPYSNTYYQRDGGGVKNNFNNSSYTNYLCDYVTSSIRSWLNDDFYNTAFSASEQAEISITTLNNNGYQTLVGNSGYEWLDSNKTNDKIFLLSFNEAINSGYGFNSDFSYEDAARRAQGSDYAVCQGLDSDPGWLLRTPGLWDWYCSFVYEDGSCNCTCRIEGATTRGVRPAMRFANIADIDIPEPEDIIVLPETYDVEAIKVTGEEEAKLFTILGSELLFDHVTSWDITLHVDGVETQPEDKVTVKIPVPEGYDPSKCEVYHIDPETGKLTDMNAYYEDGYFIFTTDHFSIYSVVELHEHSYTSSVTKESTCTQVGTKTFTCSCSDSYTETIPATGHADTNGDYRCDNGCGYEYEKPVKPETPSDPSENCDCNCHKGGIVGFFFKIILFFQKLFKTNKVCDCGVSHY